MLDLFSGLGGASRAFKERGWTVITVDNNPEFNPDYCMNIQDFHYSGQRPDLIWASPPCTEFSKMDLPPTWSCNNHKQNNPDPALMLEAVRIIRETGVNYWVIENVRGAIPYFRPYLGEYQKKVGSRYLWGVFPIFDCDPAYGKWKLPNNSRRPALRSLIPYQISKALCMAIEQLSDIKVKE